MKSNTTLQRKTQLIPTEKQECLTFVEYLDLQQRIGEVLLYTHIANENNMVGGIRVALHKKRMGVRRGFPDYIVITQKGIFAIEMKRVKGSTVSSEQKDWIELLRHFGVKAGVCYGADDAIKFLES